MGRPCVSALGSRCCRLSVVGVQWQAYGEDGAACSLGSRAVAHGELTTVRRDDAPGDVEPQPTATDVRPLVQARKRFEDPRHLLFGNACTIIAHAHIGLSL